jgi:chromosome segregation ATPase
MEEKTLLDEEIIKGLECCAVGRKCGECPYFIKKIDCLLGQRIESDLLDLINRLKENNANQVRMRCDMQRKFDDLQTLCTEKKAEIERLTEELKNCGQELIESNREQEELQDRTAELQKQVDELETVLRQERIEKKRLRDAFVRVEKQAVKDTAKEIFKEIFESVVFSFKGNEDYKKGFCDALEQYNKQLRDLAKLKGVEVEE